MTLKQKVATLLTEKELEYKDLAAAIGVSQASLSRSLSTGGIRVDSLAKIADRLNVTMDSLLSD